MIGRFSLCRVILFFFSFFFTIHDGASVCLVTISLRSLLFYIYIYRGIGGLTVYILGVCVIRYLHVVVAVVVPIMWQRRRTIYTMAPSPTGDLLRREVYIIILYIDICMARTKERRKRKNENRLLSLFFDARVDDAIHQSDN
jgi:hypothetical protein